MLYDKNNSFWVRNEISKICIVIVILLTSCIKTPTPSNFTLLGEHHGAAEQQLEISQWLAELSKTDNKTAVVMEMISVDQAELVKAFKHLQPDDPKDFSYAIGWHKTSWPDYKFYAPIIKVIWENDMHLAAGDVSKLDRQRWRRGEWAEGDPEPQFAIQAPREQIQAVISDWKQSIQASHCGTLQPYELDNLVKIQMIREAFMARQMQRLKDEGYDKVVLIAGRTHIRRDRGVPLYLGSDAKIKSIAMIETHASNKAAPAQYPLSLYGNIPPYDEVILTPSLPDKEGHCERLKRKGIIK